MARKSLLLLLLSKIVVVINGCVHGIIAAAATHWSCRCYPILIIILSQCRRCAFTCVCHSLVNAGGRAGGRARASRANSLAAWLSPVRQIPVEEPSRSPFCGPETNRRGRPDENAGTERPDIYRTNKRYLVILPALRFIPS